MNASIMLDVSYRTLQYYELDDIIPSSLTVKKMAKCYNAEWLLYYHLALNDDIGRVILVRPKIEDIFLHEEKAKSEKASLTRLKVNIHN